MILSEHSFEVIKDTLETKIDERRHQLENRMSAAHAEYLHGCIDDLEKALNEFIEEVHK